MTEINSKLGLLDKPEFWRYIGSLPERSFKALVVVDGETGKARTIISKQTGDSPPQVVVSEE
jgi:hypothetical protein